MCRITRTFDENKFKLQFNGHSQNNELVDILVRILGAEGEFKRSVAPRGPRERRLEEFLQRSNRDGDGE